MSHIKNNFSFSICSKYSHIRNPHIAPEFSRSFPTQSIGRMMKKKKHNLLNLKKNSKNSTRKLFFLLIPDYSTCSLPSFRRSGALLRVLLLKGKLKDCLGGFSRKNPIDSLREFCSKKSDYREWWCIEVLSNGKLMGEAIFFLLLYIYRDIALALLFSFQCVLFWHRSRFIKVQVETIKIRNENYTE